MKRRRFIHASTLGGVSLAGGIGMASCRSQSTESVETAPVPGVQSNTTPMVIATWNVPNATAKAWEVLQNGGSSLDAVEQGCMVEEADPANESVGLGGTPDRDGKVTLDAGIMNKDGEYGAVLCIENILHPISLARKVMEETPHVILAGEGARQFAIERGFKPVDLLTDRARREWEEWKVKSEYKPIINIENHDTIGMLAIDAKGDLSGACTTSGLGFKMRGRVGDSAIIGSGLFVDNQVGAATATGLGEEILKVVGSFLIVELMRLGKSPQEACEEAINRIIGRRGKNAESFQACFIAVNKRGEFGASSIQDGFKYTVYRDGTMVTYDAAYQLKK